MEREEAIEVIRENYPHVGFSGTEFETALRELIPELEESEDEKVRKFLVNHVSEWIGCIEHDLKISSKDVESEEELAMFKAGLAYLEKQKKQPTDAKSKRVIKAARSVLNNWLDGTDCPDVSGDFAELEYAIREYDGEERQKEQKSAEWSKEDERNLYNTIEAIKYTFDVSEGSGGSRLITWLKFHLRPQSHWKPSEEQMRFLLAVINEPNNAGSESCHIILKSLYADLQKLL